MKPERIVVDKRSYIKAAINLGRRQLTAVFQPTESPSGSQTALLPDEKPGEVRKNIMRLIDFIKEH